MGAEHGFEAAVDHAAAGVSQALRTGLQDMEHTFARVLHDIFGGGSDGTSAVSLDDIRWEGMSNQQLAQAVQQLGQGPGAESMQRAADALANIAQNLAQIDQTLRQQLQAIGVNWQSQAADLAQEATTSAAAYGGTVTDAGGQSSAGMNQQAEAYASAKNGAPHPTTLRGDTQTNLIDGVYHTLTGHESDHAQQVAQTNAARSQAIDTMSNYTSATQASVGSYQTPPLPPGINLQTGSVGAVGVTSVSGYVGPSGSAAPSGFPGFSGGPPTTGGAPAAGAVPPGGLPLPGGLPGGGGFPGAPGGGSTGSPSPLQPGPFSGVGNPGPVPGGTFDASVPPAVANGASSLMDDAGVGAAIVGGSTAAGVAGATAQGDRLVRGRQNNQAGFADEEFGEGESARQSARALGELESEQAAEVRAAERFGAVAEPPPTMLEPAVAGRHRDEDEEHHSRYHADAEDFFADERPVVPGVLDGGGGDSGEGA